MGVRKMAALCFTATETETETEPETVLGHQRQRARAGASPGAGLLIRLQRLTTHLFGSAGVATDGEGRWKGLNRCLHAE